MIRKFFFRALMFLVIITIPGCHSSTEVSRFHGLQAPGEIPKSYQKTTTWAVHFLFGWKPVIGNADMKGPIENFYLDAKKSQSGKAIITHTDFTTLWWVFPPFSFLLTPVFKDVYGYTYP